MRAVPSCPQLSQLSQSVLFALPLVLVASSLDPLCSVAWRPKNEICGACQNELKCEPADFSISFFIFFLFFYYTYIVGLYSLWSAS